MDGHKDEQDFSFTTTDESSGVSSDKFFSTIFSNDLFEYPMSGDDLLGTSPMENIADDMEGTDHIFGGELEDLHRWLDESESEGNFSSPPMSSEGKDVWSPCQSAKSSKVSMVLPSVQTSLTLPVDSMEIDSQLTIQHLLMAYGEAIEMEQRELAEVIMRSIIEKVNPVGETLERLAYNLFQSAEKQAEYLKQELSKNFAAAFKAFYQIFPYGRFAHFTANLAILEAMPDYIETIHIIDFQTMDGVQWAPMIEAAGRLQKVLRLTLIKSAEDCGGAPSYWRFQETKRQLYDHARSCGLNLKVEEVEIEGLVSEIKKTKKRGGGREWLAFNCMVALPHMGKGRSRSSVTEFLRVAKELLASSATNQGIIIIGDGDAGERLKSCSGFGSFFGVHLNHYRALCESMEWNFPSCFAEAIITMESLFVAPLVSSPSWLQKWEEVREGSDLHTGIGLKGLKLTKKNLMEAKRNGERGREFICSQN